MKARIVYESVFGNTKAIAEAVAEGLATTFEAETVEVNHAPASIDGLDLLIIGGPTYAWAMSRPTTRKAAREQAAKQGIAAGPDGIGVREWLAALPEGRGTKAATFDTGAGTFGILPGGSAAKGEAVQLARRGYSLLAEPHQFLITMTGDRTVLKPGELERARQWGAELARSAAAA